MTKDLRKNSRLLNSIFPMVKENACFGRNIAPRGDQHGGCVWLS
jgi:hypothetical protein